jgi:uncharacterized protein with FMN-binding domain
MKRAPFVLAGTAAGLGLLLSFHTKPVTVNLGTATGSSTSKGASGTAVASGSTPSSTSGGSGSKSPSGSSSTSSGSSSTTTDATKASGATRTRSADGAVVNYYYGDISVRVTASGSHITNVAIASLNEGGNFRSVSIDEAAIPTLEQETLAAQNAKIQSVSGATYTSAGYTASLQSALKRLGL